MKRKTKSWTYGIITFITGIGILLALIYHAGFKRFSDIILQASLYWIAVSVMVYAASWIFRTWRLERFTAHAGNNIKILDLFKLYISGYALNAILPAKLGDAVTVGYLKMKGINIGRSAAIILQTRIMDVLALVLLSIPAFVLFFEKGIPGWIMITIFFCIIVVVVPMGIVVLDKNRKFSHISEKLENKFGHKFLKLTVEKTKLLFLRFQLAILERLLLLRQGLLVYMKVFWRLFWFCLASPSILQL